MVSLENVFLLEILLLPLIGAIISFVFLKKKPWLGTVISFTWVLITSVASMFAHSAGASTEISWFEVGRYTFQVGLYYDSLSAIMVIVVAVVALLVTVFSIEYMKHDEAKPRYFALLGLFAFSMYGIVLSSNLLLTFIFWELVGLSSYLLIGFWYQKEAPPISSFKAFIMNKIGDIGFLLGIFVLFAYFKTLNIQQLLDLDILSSGIPDYMLVMMGIGLFLAAIGKSAQFPLQTWLPDAMTGPTPVSALIHAATMVAAGVYLMVRLFPLLSPDVLVIVGTIGGITAFMGAFAAFAQNDIKKILAFSTVSQLGYMIMAIGAGFPLAAFFHLTTHAFFKAGLFLCSGSIIHYYHETNHEEGFETQDIRNMGGLMKVLPFTFIAFTICMLSLAGIPLMSGFLSKEMILNGLVSASHLSPIIIFFGFASVFMTAAYMARLYFKVFFNKVNETSKFKESHLVKWPLIVLSMLSFGIIFSMNPISPSVSWFTTTLSQFSGVGVAGHSSIIPILSIGLAVSGLLLSYLYIEKKLFSGAASIARTIMYQTSNRNFYLDDIYLIVVVNGFKKLSSTAFWLDRQIIDRLVILSAKSQVVFAYILAWVDKFLIDGIVNLISGIAKLIGNRTRSVQGGSVQGYLMWALFGLLLIFYFMNHRD